MGRFKRNTIIVIFIVGLLLFAVLHPAFAGSPMQLTTQENIVSVHADERVLLRYRYKNVPFKPYVQQLFSPRGFNVLRDAPADHLHHHGLMFAVTVDGVNFWEERQAPGRQVHRAFADVGIDRRDGVPLARFTERLDWINPRSGELLLEESRTIEVCHLKEPEVTLLAWQSKFEPPQGKKSVTLTGAHYHGLGMRFLRDPARREPKSMDVGGQFFNAAGKPGSVVRGNERLVRATWCAYTASANGAPVTIAMLGHPDNERHPAVWFTMTKPFAYLSAALNLHKQPLKITSDKPLVLRYAVVLWDEQVKVDQVDRLYRRWVAWPYETVHLRKLGQAK